MTIFSRIFQKHNVYRNSDSIEEKTKKIVHANISNDEKWKLFNRLNSQLNIRRDPDSFWLCMEMAKQAKREKRFEVCIYFNCLPIIYNLTSYSDMKPGGLTNQIAIAIRKSKGSITETDFDNLFKKAYSDFFSDLDFDVNKLETITWNEVQKG